MVTAPPSTRSTRNAGVASAALRWTVKWSAPGPEIASEPLITNSPLVRVIVPVTAKSTLPPAAIAARNEPGPLSLSVVTVTADNRGTASIVTNASMEQSFFMEFPGLKDLECWLSHKSELPVCAFR